MKKKINFIWVSNFSVEQIKEAQKYSKNKIITNQIPYNLYTRNVDYKGNCKDMENSIIPYCKKNNIQIIAYRPIERKLILDNETVNNIAKKYNNTPSQIAISWLLSKDNISVICKSSNFNHLSENLLSTEINMEQSDLEVLNKIDYNFK